MPTQPTRRFSGLERLLGFRLTPVTTWLLLIELGIFLVYLFTPRALGVGEHLALTPTRVLREPWQVLTSPWLHLSGGALFGNLLGLFFLGPLVERALGSRRFVLFLVATSVAGSLAAAVIGGLAGWRQPLGGCGPAVVALLAAFGALNGRQQVLFLGFAPMRALHLALFLGGLWLLLALLGGDRVGLVACLAAGGAGLALATGRLPLDRLLARLQGRWTRLRHWRQRRRYKVLQGGRSGEKRYLN